MKFSENWLRSFIDPPADRDELVRRLTMAGLEVEAVEALGAGLDGVLVGEIESAEPHPNADKLRVCRVRTGGETLTIVCGAPNARAGLKAPLAMVGAKLPGGIEIRRAALRGVESNGMLCSGRELGLGADADGLWELPADAPVGVTLASYLALPDASIELKLTPNRPDCLGLRGLASEVAALFALPPVASDVRAVPARNDAALAVRLEAPADCPRYLGRVVRGVDPRAATPTWLAERLRRAGLRPISAIVDCTNYVMLELGQPMHAFDLARIEGEVVVRRGREGEGLKLLDGREVAVDGGFLMIADARKPLAIAGVMGGWDSRVTDDSVDIFLESAHFSPDAISGRARRLGLHTDASHRFERGVDPELPRAAIERLTELVLAIAGGEPGPVVEAVSAPHLPQCPPVRLRRARLARVLGIEVPDARVESILRGLGFEVAATTEGWTVAPPSRRFDIAIEEDLIEEVIRVHGYDAVPVRAPSGTLVVAPEPEGRVPDSALREVLRARGYSEAVCFAFVGAEALRTWQLEDGAIALANPLSHELAVMRTSLLPGLVDALRRNLARQAARVRLFEIGHTFAAGSAGPRESQCLAGVAIGSAAPEQWGAPRRALDFHDLKGDIEQLLATTGDPASFVFQPVARPWLHPGRSAEIVRAGQAIGLAGALHPALAGALDLPQDTWVFELAVEPLAARPVPLATEVSRLPSVRRDLAIVVDRKVPWGALETAIRAAAGPLLRGLVLFDEYSGKGLPDSARSLAIGLILQDDSRTLTDEDASGIVASVVAVIAESFGGQLRG